MPNFSYSCYSFFLQPATMLLIQAVDFTRYQVFNTMVEAHSAAHKPRGTTAALNAW